MNRGQIRKMSYKKILYWTACVLIGLTLTALTVSEVYARFISSKNSDESANVASVGIEIFELKEYGKTVEHIDLTKVVPGADIPGPHIKLRINSEVNYSLFVKVKVPNANCIKFILDDSDTVTEEQTITYRMSKNWQIYGDPYDEGGETVYTYQYSSVFKAGQQYDCTGENEIEILDGDEIYVSQYYNEYDKETPQNFTLTFEALIRQVQ